MKNTSSQSFLDLSIHQRMLYLHDFTSKVMVWLPKIRPMGFSPDRATLSDRDILLQIPLYRALRFAQDPSNQHLMPEIYRSLARYGGIALPNRFRCFTVIISLMVQLYSKFLPGCSEARLLDLCKAILLEFNSINEDEAAKLDSTFSFCSKSNLFIFQFDQQRYEVLLNPRNSNGYELTILAKK